MRTSALLTLTLLALGTFSVSAVAQDDLKKKIQSDVQKELENASKGLVERIVGAVEKNVKAVIQKQAAEIANLKKQLESAQAQIKKLQGLTAEVAKRDAQIKQLQGEVAKLKASLKKIQTPPKKLTSAYAGIAVAAADRGAKVVAVVPGAPANKAGIADGDIIVSVAGQKVTAESLSSTIRSHAPGSKVKVDYIRGDKALSAEISLVDKAAFQKSIAKKVDTPPKKVEKPKAVLGVLIEEKDSGLEVQNVEKGLTGEVAKLANGDIVLSVNGANVKTLDDMKAALGKLKAGDSLTLVLKRGEATVNTQVLAGGEEGGLKAKVVKYEVNEPKKPEPKKVVKPEPKPGYLGLTVEESDDAVTVTEIREGAAAWAYGIKVGDIVLGVNDIKVKTIEDLKKGLTGKNAGQAIQIVVRREVNTITIKGITLGAKGQTLKKVEKVDQVVVGPPKKKEKGHLGILANETEKAVVVVQVTAGGPGAKGKLQKDDQILKINGKDVKNFDDMITILGGVYAGDTITIVVKRGDKTETLKVTLEKKS